VGVTRYAYSNSNPFVTGLLIEAVTGRSYAAVLKERVLDPLGLQATYLPGGDDPTVAAPVLRGYAGETGEDITDGVSFGGWAWASGSVTVAISTQYTDELLPQLRASEAHAVCIALGVCDSRGGCAG